MQSFHRDTYFIDLLFTFSEGCISLKSEWNESLAHVAAIQKMKTEQATAKAEFAIERKASIMVSLKSANYMSKLFY